MPTKLLLIGYSIAVFLMLAFCGGHYELPVQSRLGSDMAPRDLVRLSDIIVSGVVREAEYIVPRPLCKPQWRLTRVVFDVKCVLKGHRLSESIQFYHYSAGPSTVPPVSPSVFVKGKPSVVFLLEHGSTLRTTVDWGVSEVAVCSAGPSMPPKTSREIELRIAELMVSSEHCSPRQLIGQLRASGHFIERLVGKAESVALLRRLLAHESREVRREACVALVASFAGQRDCIKMLIERGDFLDTDQSILSELAAGDAKRDRLIREEFLPRPFAFVAGDNEDILDSIRALVQHRDQDVKDAACNMLFTMYPQYRDERCGQRRRARPPSARK